MEPPLAVLPRKHEGKAEHYVRFSHFGIGLDYALWLKKQIRRP